MTIHTRFASLALLLLPCLTQAQFDGISVAGSLTADELLRVNEAFRPQAIASEASVDVVWSVEPGYYLYRKQFRVFLNGEEVSELNLPVGEIAYDPFFDEELEIYRDEVLLNFSGHETGQISIRFQGCADAGYCYPPSWVAFESSPQSDSVTYLGLVEGPAGPQTEVAGNNSTTYLIAAFGLAIVLGLFWLGWRKLFKSIPEES